MKKLLVHAKRMRKKPTDAERLLWAILRDRRLGGFKFQRQVPIGPYIVDFLCLESRVIVEADGGQHNFQKISLDDQQRSEWLINENFKILRFWNNQILHELQSVKTVIFNVCKQNK